jgi:hypothetical protein
MRTLVLALAAAGWLAGGSARADVTDCQEIVSIPVVITQQGVHCLKQNLSAALADGAAIEVAANNVTVDLNGFKLGNLAAGPETAAVGVAAIERKNVVVRNGLVRGFAMGVMILGDPSGTSFGHRVEGLSLDSNLLAAIFVAGSGIVVRDNQITNTSNVALNQALAKRSLRAPALRQFRSRVASMSVGFGAIGIIGVLSNSVIEDNKVTSTSALGEATGIVVSQSSGVAITGNFIAGVRATSYASGVLSGIDNTDIVISSNTIMDGSTDGPFSAFGIENLSEAVCLNNTIMSFSSGQTCECTYQAGTLPVELWDGRSNAAKSMRR